MALIRCYDCGKEVSSLATACPSCGAPPQPATGPPPLPAAASRTKRFSSGTIALLTGVVLVLVIRAMTHQSSSVSVGTSPTPATTEAKTTSSPAIETVVQSSPSLTTKESPTAEVNTTSSPPTETAAQSSTKLITAETPTTEANTSNLPPTKKAAQSSTELTTAETPTAEANTASSAPIEAAAQSSPSFTTNEPASVSDRSTAAAAPSGATYQVVGVPLNDYLNVRSEAGSDSQVVTKLEPGERGIQLGRERVTKGETTWQQITVHGQTGWVNAAYIDLETQAATSPAEPSTAR